MIRAFALAALVVLAAGAAQAQPQAGFDCGKASTVVEKAICGHEELATLDRAMTQRYGLLRGAGDAQAQQWLKDAQLAWITGRNACASSPECEQREQCIGAAYYQRVAALDADIAGKRLALTGDAMADICQNTQTTMEINMCLDTQLKWTEAAVERQADALRRQFAQMMEDEGRDYGAMDALEATLKQFPGWRDSLCRLTSMQMAGGTGASTVYIGCAQDATADLLGDLVGMTMDQ